jgi:hypothetical protein
MAFSDASNVTTILLDRKFKSRPGNVGEMQNVIERAVILSPGPALHIPPDDLKPGAAPADGPAGAPVTLADAEREHILGVLRETGWVVGGPKGAADRLAMKHSTLQKKMKKLGVSRPNQCPPGSGCAPRVALGRWHFPSLPRVVSPHPIRNSLFIPALRGAATKFTSLARPSPLTGQVRA